MSWGPTKEVQTPFEATGASKDRIAVSNDPTGPQLTRSHAGRVEGMAGELTPRRMQ